MSPEELIALLHAANIRVPPSGVRLNGQWHYPVVAVAGNAEVGQTCSAA
jgi:hypothetical protein